MRYAVAGASGYIGGHLVSLLARRGHNVVAMGRDASRLGARFADLAGVQALPYRRSPTGDPDPVATLSGATSGGRIDAVVNLAGLAHVRGAPAQAYKEGVSFSRALAEACSLLGIPLLVNLSSIAVRELASARHFGLRHYAAAKRDAENVLTEWAQAHALAAISLRPPAVWGPDAPGSFATIRGLIRTRLPLPLASIKAKRCYIHVESLCEKIALLLDAASDRAPPAGHTILEISDAPQDLREIFERVAQEMHASLWVVPMPVAAVQFTLALIGKHELVDIATHELSVDQGQFDRYLRLLSGETD